VVGREADVLVHIIADYGVGDLAFAEVVQRIKLQLPDAEPVLVPVPSFATVAAGFCIAQLGLYAGPPGTIIYHNVAPRQDDPAARSGNAGERLAYARLPTDVHVIGVNAGYALSFIRETAKELRRVASPADGSQFRSRDIFPEAAAAVARAVFDRVGETIELSSIPEPPSSVLAYVDGYGNMKTTIAYNAHTVAPGKRIRIRINQEEHVATMSDGTFAVPEGELAFAPGSSGWPMRGGEEIRWIEIFLRGGDAWQLFRYPSNGSPIVVT
jgi:S-adenosylmethionine hydrolase